MHDCLAARRIVSVAEPCSCTPGQSLVFRGYISEDDPGMFRVAAGLEDCATTVHASNWYATLNHHRAFIIRTADVRDRT